MQYAPEVALTGLGMAPVATELRAAEPTMCMTCARPLAAGDPIIPYRPSSGTFTDWQYLAARTGVVCGWCAPFLENTLLMATQKCVIAANGAWALYSAASWRWLFDPAEGQPRPQAPYVVVYADQLKQHLLWRAAVTVDDAIVRVQVGRTGLRVDRAALARARTLNDGVVVRMAAHGLRTNAGHPYITLPLDRQKPDYGIVRADVLRAAADDVVLARGLAALASIGEGERWALGIVTRTNLTPSPSPLTRLSPEPSEGED